MRRIYFMFGMLAATVAQSQQIGTGVGVVQSGLNANTTKEMPSGYYSVVNGTNFPASTFNWHHFVAFDHANPDGYQLQLSSPYTDPINTLYFRTVVGGVYQSWQRVATENSNTFKDAQYFPGNGVWNAAGQLGIGTKTPQSQLHIASPVGDQFAGIRFIPATTAADPNRVLGFRNGGLCLSGGSGTATTASSAEILLDNTGIDFKTGDGAAATISKVKILNNGAVGIGIPAPKTNLEVKENILVSSGTNSLHIRTDGANSYITNKNNFVGNGSSTNGQLIIHGQKGILIQTGDGGIGECCGEPRLAIDDYGMRFITNGKRVLNIWSNGTVEANRIEVKNLNFPDYVFADDYKLRSLSEVEAFIGENSHLPEVPSAAHVAENGMDLTEMNNVMLKKIEELTLYLIEQDKKISALQKQNEQLLQSINK